MTALVTFSQPNNTWLLLAWRFGTQGDTSWSFTGKSFLCDFKADPSQVKPDLVTSSATNTILILDVVNRILQFNVTDLVIRQKLQPGPYFGDLIMVDNVTGERDPLMNIVMTITQGVTLED
jgi:hypothetical protein